MVMFWFLNQRKTVFELVRMLSFTVKLFRMAAPAANPFAEPQLFVNSLVLPETFYKNIVSYV